MALGVVILEAIFVGITLVILSIGLTFVYKIIYPNAHSECKNWNKNYIMEISVFILGVATHLLYEVTGINRWYKNKKY